MKKLIAFIGSYTCYYLGDFFSKLMEYSVFNFLYSPYQRLMNWSVKLQDWGGLEKPWKNTEKENEEFDF